ncbi:hypothetical protein TIFTF001_032508 [Ficus carica]|uniref:Uncharacterized protein n=1 Tax=Ficus carica TaxID=3494 RepID=A0AA88DWW3_FICCA|nr:hypothetical protein TIFTF001_032508 [Ficus carica]
MLALVEKIVGAGKKDGGEAVVAKGGESRIFRLMKTMKKNRVDKWQTLKRIINGKNRNTLSSDIIVLVEKIVGAVFVKTQQDGGEAVAAEGGESRIRRKLPG